MIGFTKDEVKDLIIHTNINDVDNTLKILEGNYNGYIFNEYLDGQRVFNPVMVLYYLEYYKMSKKPPINLLDKNIMSDYDKIASIFDLYANIDNKQQILSALLQSEKIILSKITPQFNLDLEIDKGGFYHYFIIWDY